MVSPSSAPAALSIAGSDSGANAGIQADLLSFAANGVYGTTAISCLTAQNPRGVCAIQATDVEVLEAQIEQVLQYYPIRAIKTGMLFNEALILAVARKLERVPRLPLVVDPVSVATSGHPLLQDSALEALKVHLLPLASVLTPNLDEAKLLLGREISNPSEMERAALDLAKAYQAYALVKGGHLSNDDLVDVVATPDGQTHHFHQTRIHGIDTHGSGCTLSAAIAAQIARGQAIIDAIAKAREYLRACMETPVRLPTSPFINHLP
ncbi:bifunctional hydroxymethylpyrimidine kinase/phosphomethylpyrimidine kinase [Pelagicoccus sp. NFK12]|uniref:hydroxymethylpyrimidine kinase n=1 Tax=Pelagicoccus enzymogenes TaxID=2773457 RepID=A0A927F686_9BACT|nr:bifunctional hydroxymethylpyrimidine kinase/phosphomethylpyrimidine kinase [Pelagicoccus enzymogenes]MBD5778972.1 bifunctional hydroxymethylpyrimidine kinase/phosphomethylpyrimidine kinase [Pelagicoccus enzymogenes]